MSFAGLSDVVAGMLGEVPAGIPAPQLEALEVALPLRGRRAAAAGGARRGLGRARGAAGLRVPRAGPSRGR